jgi:hypothetical protein
VTRPLLGGRVDEELMLRAVSAGTPSRARGP